MTQSMIKLQSWKAPVNDAVKHKLVEAVNKVFILKALLLAVVLCVSCYGVRYFFWSIPSSLLIKHVEILNELNNQRAAQVQNILLPLVNKGFFSVDIELIQKRLMTVDWVFDAHVVRQWPDTIKVNLVEQLPIARWNNALINRNGDVFNQGQAEEYDYLPLFLGPAGYQQKSIRYYKELNRILAHVGLQVKSLQVDSRGSWQFMANTGLQVVLGSQSIENKLSQFIAMYESLQKNIDQPLKIIDLRYSNGVAVTVDKRLSHIED